MQGDIFMVGRQLKRVAAVLLLVGAVVATNYFALSSFSNVLSVIHLGLGTAGALFAIEDGLNLGNSFGGVLARGTVGYTVGFGAAALLTNAIGLA